MQRFGLISALKRNAHGGSTVSTTSLISLPPKMSGGSTVDRLIGIPWGSGNPPEEADCVSLAIYAQEILWGRKVELGDIDTCWHDKDLRQFSHQILEIIPQFCNEVKEFQIGDIATVETIGYCHVLTLVESGLILHSGLNSASRISRYRPLKGIRFWRLRG